MTSINDVTGDRIVSKSSEDYRNNYDKIFRKEKPKSKPIIVSNKVQCKQCGDIIESKHRHDFVSCSCGKVMIDGGREYMRWLGNFEDFIDLSEITSEDESGFARSSETFEDDWFEKVRETFTWTSYGKLGNEPAKKTLLKNLDTEHILAILDTQRHIKGTEVGKWFKLELEYRGVNHE